MGGGVSGTAAPSEDSRRDACTALGVELGVHAWRPGVLALGPHRLLALRDTWGGAELGGGAHPGPRQGPWEPRSEVLLASIQCLKLFQGMISLLPVVHASVFILSRFFLRPG